jgi:hypothetical protein
MWQKLAEGTGFNLASVVGYENEIAEGQRGKLTLNLRSPLDPSWVEWLQQQLDSRGVTEGEVEAWGNNVDITYRKGYAWLPIILLIIAGLIVLAVLIVSWQFAKEAPIGFSLLTIGAIAAIVVGGIYLVRRQT